MSRQLGIDQIDATVDFFLSGLGCKIATVDDEVLQSGEGLPTWFNQVINIGNACFVQALAYAVEQGLFALCVQIAEIAMTQHIIEALCSVVV